MNKYKLCMAIMRWNPWELAPSLDAGWDLPAQGLDIYETEDSVIAEAALPGIPEDKIDITIEDGTVRIVGENRERTKDDRRRYMSTLSTSYNYSFRLPEGAIADQNPVCMLEDGVLTLQFPKEQKAPPRKIKVSRRQSKKIGNGENNKSKG
jgi:HSP20 family molecular chaperone IbpA